MHIALRALVKHHQVTGCHMVADEDMPLSRDQLLVVPPHINAQKEKQDCMQTNAVLLLLKGNCCSGTTEEAQLIKYTLLRSALTGTGGCTHSAVLLSDDSPLMDASLSVSHSQSRRMSAAHSTILKAATRHPACKAKRLARL